MRGSFLIASALIGGGLIAHVVLDDPGYVAISVGRSLFETTVPVFLLLLTGLYFLTRAIIESLTARRRLATLRMERRKRHARDDTQRGLLDLAAVTELRRVSGVVMTWPVNDLTRAGDLARLGVDGLTSDRPGAISGLAAPEAAA